MPTFFFFLLLIIFAVLGFELRAYTVSHSTSPILRWVFSREDLANYLSRLASNLVPPYLCLLSS
jgi:hypothetical protein